MSTIRTLITGLTVVAAGTGATAVLAASSTASAGTVASSRSFTVHAHHGSETNLDLGKSGFSAGDQDLFTGSLHRNGHQVGRFVGNCTTARVGRKSADQMCEFVLRLHTGQITAAGTAVSTRSGPGTFALPILGGTGRYGAAAGEITVTATNGSSFPIRVSLR